MPVSPSYPGVYIEEVPSSVRTIVAAATSITAFIGRAQRGPLDKATRIKSFADFGRRFGGIWSESMMSYAVRHYFLNGGTDAYIIRVANEATPSKATLPAPASERLGLMAASPGAWGERLQAIVDHDTMDKDKLESERDPKLFNLTLQEMDGEGKSVVAEEKFANVSVDPDAARAVDKVLETQSQLAYVDPDVALPANRPDETDAAVGFGEGYDGLEIDDAQITNNGDLLEFKAGVYALEDVEIFNLLCIPPLTRTADVEDPTWINALNYCKDRRAMLIVDPPSEWTDAEKAKNGMDNLAASPLGLTPDENAVLYFPRVRLTDSEKDGRLETFAPGGTMAGVIARTDAERGVWKAPAGTEATLAGVRELAVNLTDGDNGTLNPLGLNCLRVFRTGIVSWGARTLAGADRLASQWKYVPVRRMALHIENSLYTGLKWVVFEPNDEPLWAQIRLNVGTFMQDLFRQGAFQGTSPREAYFVKCDQETTTQSDIDKGIVYIEVGFAPLKPAEFVIIRISQMTREASA